MFALSWLSITAGLPVSHPESAVVFQLFTNSESSFLETVIMKVYDSDLGWNLQAFRECLDFSARRGSPRILYLHCRSVQ